MHGCVPTRCGGLGGEYRGYARYAAEMGRHCGAPALPFTMHACTPIWTGHIADDLDAQSFRVADTPALSRGEEMADAAFAAQLALSLLWAFYAGILIGVGIWRSYAPIRLAGIVLIALTVLKVFLVDLSGLEGIYRVLGLVVVGAVLLVVSFLSQRGRSQTTAEGSAGRPDVTGVP